MKLHLSNKVMFLFVVLFAWTSHSQQTEMPITYEAKMHKATDLYNSKLYSGAQKMFVEIAKNTDLNSNLKTNAEYYDAMCAVKLRQPKANQKVLDFIKKYPNSKQKDNIYYNVGNFYFDQKQLWRSLKWYSKVNQNTLNSEQRDEMNFRMGYTFLVMKRYKDAKAKFAKLLQNPRYNNDARYYYGYIAYRQKNYEDANKNFERLPENTSQKKDADYYLLDMAFKNGKYEKAVELGEKILPNSKKSQKTDVVKMIGESYFKLGKYEQSIPYLLQYKDVKGKWNNTNLYYIGYAYYKKNDFENATRYFTKIIGGKNSTAQNAYYHLGICYLKLGKKSEALNAFKNAYDMSFDLKIKEDSALNYTKLSYEQGNPYKRVSEVLKDYLDNYPQSKSYNEIKNLLITSYLHEKNFEDALSYLKKHKTSENEQLLSEVSLYRAIELFQNKEYKNAIPYFLTALKSDNSVIKNKARFWLGENYYLLNRYKNALNHFLDVDKTSNINELQNLDYNIAYTYFKLNNYQGAIGYFKNCINNPNLDSDKKIDARTRLGDSYYAVKDYKNAIKNYGIIINNNDFVADYALYQKALSEGLLGNNSQKISDLTKIGQDYQNSVYNDDALFQIAGTYTSIKQEQQAINYYDKLLRNYPKSHYVSSVLLRKGLLYYGKKDYENALVNFKKVVEKYPNSEDAKQAITNIKNVYIDKSDVPSYVAWTKTLPNVNISNREIDDSSFIVAENQFFNNDYKSAIPKLKSYLNEFQNGIHLLKANYYLGESYLNTNQKEEAIPYYNYVVNQEKNEYSEDVLAKLSQIYLDFDKWNEATPLLERLEQEANLGHNITYAKSNLMKAYYEKKNYPKAKIYAENVLNLPKLEEDVKNDAELILARIAIVNKDFSTAREYYEIIDKTATNKVKAESLYYKALFLHQDKLYEKSNEVVQNLIADYSNYKYWGVKSYIVMAKNYFALGDSYQSVYILENVIKNFSQFPDLTEEAKNELYRVKNKEAKENESINSKTE